MENTTRLAIVREEIPKCYVCQYDIDTLKGAGFEIAERDECYYFKSSNLRDIATYIEDDGTFLF